MNLKFNLLFGVFWLALFAPTTRAGAQPSAKETAAGTGEQVYVAKCAGCHGGDGTGTAKHKKPLAGDLSILELTRVIEKTMPEDDPGSCTGDEARLVAEYIHQAFYSVTAQERTRPARVELSRLTVRQYQQVAADLIGSLNGNGVGDWGTERGLRAQYYRKRNMSRDNRVLERIDPTVQFDFGEKSPDEKIEPHEFSIRWEGSILPPETGEYEFTVKTEHATRLWINEQREPLVDAWVKSGSDTEYRATIRLLGGRIYPLKLEYSKAKQGVDDSKDGKPKPVAKSSIALFWKLPNRAMEVIPARCLSPKGAATVFVLATPFPPDDRSVGYERGTSISKAWDQATTDAAIEIATHLSERRERLVGAADDSPDRPEKLRAFCSRFAERAFRRPLSDAEKQVYIEQQISESPTAEIAFKRCLLLILKSPRFLYRELGSVSSTPEAQPMSHFDTASRLSFTLWDSLPDDALWRAAAEGKLGTREEVQAQASRMVNDLRTRAKAREFFMQWLKVDRVTELSKDAGQFAEFCPEIANDLQTSLEIYVDSIVWSDASDFRQLLLADTVPLNGRLAKFYGTDLPPDATFQPVVLNPGQRAGVLTHPFLLTSFAYNAASSPIHRGVFISRSLLGRVLKPPPEAVAPLPIDLQPDLTTRERTALQTKSESCMACHGMINPLGFSLENFDAVGRYRDKEPVRSQEQEKPVDSSGSYLTREGQTVTFHGARELAAYLAQSDETHSAFVQQLFQYSVKQPIRAYGPNQLAELKQAFVRDGFSIRKLLAEIATVASWNSK